jgi:hypothetical protein
MDIDFKKSPVTVVLLTTDDKKISLLSECYYEFPLIYINSDYWARFEDL